MKWQWKTVAMNAQENSLRMLNAANDWVSFSDDDNHEFNTVIDHVRLLCWGDVHSPAVGIQLTPDVSTHIGTGLLKVALTPMPFCFTACSGIGKINTSPVSCVFRMEILEVFLFCGKVRFFP